MRDISRAGYEFASTRLVDLPERLSLRDLLERRVRHDVETHNRAPQRLFEGLVQPSDAIRHAAGHRLPAARSLDPAPMVAAAHAAVSAGMLRLRVGDGHVEDLDAIIDLAAAEVVVAELARPVVAAGA